MSMTISPYCLPSQQTVQNLTIPTVFPTPVASYTIRINVYTGVRYYFIYCAIFWTDKNFATWEKPPTFSTFNDWNPERWWCIRTDMLSVDYIRKRLCSLMGCKSPVYKTQHAPIIHC